MTTSVSGNLTTTTNPRQLSDGNGLNGGPGTILGLSAADPIGFYGLNQGVVQFGQPGTHDVSITTVGTTAVFAGTTYTGGVGTSNYTVGDIVAALKAVGLLAK